MFASIIFSAKNICNTCGTQYTAEKEVPQLCTICNDARQYIGDRGQTWTSLADLSKGKTIRFQKINEQLYDLRISPDFAIGQKAFLVLSASGNILWDCLPFIDEQTIAFIQSKGGIKAIAVSHPHYYSLMVEWARIFNCPVFIHHNDKQWIMNQSSNIQLWEGSEWKLWDDIKIINTGGHFPGSCVLYLPYSIEKGALLTGDTIYVARNRKKVTFMYSYPNHIPLPRVAIEQINDSVKNYSFDAIYGAFEWSIIEKNAKQIFYDSVKEYLQIIS